MQFPKLTLENVLRELIELPADWLDDAGRQLVAQVEESLAYLRTLRRPLEFVDIEDALRKFPGFFDICRLLLGIGQEPAAHLLCDHLGERSATWAQLRKRTTENPAAMAGALAQAGILEKLRDQLQRQWRLEDVLIERFKHE